MMRRADRLFQIIQLLRRSSRPVTAAEMAAELEVSVRTIYRDVADLIGQRVPIAGEAGFGYVLDDAYDMPPLMLTSDEVEAAVLGAQWVAANGDVVLANAARDLIAKILAVVPEQLRPMITAPSMSARPPFQKLNDGIDIVRLRQWIRTGGKVRISYRDEEGAESERVIWPIIIGYFDNRRTIAAWCEKRQDFRSFRTDRVVEAAFLDEKYPGPPGALRLRWKQAILDRYAAREKDCQAGRKRSAVPFMQ
ncbi:MAG: YafY family protein [Sphingopyxis sp.]|uniref:helix-turn-helix transcriptional regulator n=1 Tax=Sphingopyxis sp. TaxID=1908224 RepID=UPI002ABA1D52|nr:YafY family protein [Sphingopyxis sp.]MDZ3832011.1 YafY family protein [Sphingopyxis sp.]